MIDEDPATRSRVETPADAPDDLRLLQAFVNSEDRKANRDALASPRHLSDWLAHRDLVPVGTELTLEDLERAREIRAGVRALIDARDASPPEDVMERLDRAARGARPQVCFHLDGSSSFKSGDFDEAMGLLLGLVVTARLAGVWSRLKVCENADCQAVYYDYANRRSSKWCTRRCGDVMRTRRHRRARAWWNARSGSR